MKASVIVPSYNSSRTIRSCLESLLAQRADDFEIVVVDDASTDGSLAIVRGYSRVKVVSLDRNRGPAAARNAGVGKSSGEVLIFLDSDCFVSDVNWIARHLERLQRGSPNNIVGGSISANGPGVIAGAFAYNHWYSCHPRLPVLPWGVRHLVSTNLSVSRNVFEDLGGFDEALRAGEDVEFCARALRHGYALDYCNEIVVQHKNRTSFREFVRVNFDYGKTRIAMKRKGAYRLPFLLQEHPVLNALFMLPLTTLLTLRVLFAWLPYDLKVVPYLPLVFLGQLMMVCGTFHSLIRPR
jgi:glycosyltransferase involved in cell wall biosynthesis